MQLVAAIEEYTRGAKELPTLPGVALKILETVQNDQTGLKELGDIVATDPPLSAKILKLVNSPFFGFPTKIGSVNHAINLLGTGTVKNLSLGLSLVGAYRTGSTRDFDYSLFWKKSLIAATASRMMARWQMPEREEDLFFLGLIHNIGELALAQCADDKYQKVAEYHKQTYCPLHEAESRVFDFNHMEIGEYLVRSWGLPENFSRAIRYHHVPDNLKSNDKEIVAFTANLHLASLCAEMFYLANKENLLKQFNEAMQQYRPDDSVDLNRLLEQVYEQTLHVFPIFEVNLGSEKENLDLMIALQNEASREKHNQMGVMVNKLDAEAPSTACGQRRSVGHILVVDDEKTNLELIEAMLEVDKYQISRAFSGKEALEVADKQELDVILLDVMMPEMDGFEVCRQLKLNPATRAIPVLMVTALNKTAHRVRAMETGADDFLNKPVDRTELLVRVRSLLRIKRYHDELRQSLEEIGRQNERLRELERAKDRLTHMIVHDLNNPLMAIAGNLELMLLNGTDLTDEHQKTLTSCTGFCQDLKAMTGELLMIHQMENGKLKLQRERLDLYRFIDDLQAQFAVRAAAEDIRLSFEAAELIPTVAVDRRLMKRVMSNLIDNALRHTPAGGAVRIEADFQNDDGLLTMRVKDTGSGLAPQHCEKIFELYEQVESKDDGVKNGAGGLGLAFCKMAVEAHKGRIWAESAGTGSGTAFHVSIPA